MKFFVKFLLIIVVCLIVLVFGYFLSISCDATPQISFLKYLYDIKCKKNEIVSGGEGTLPIPTNTNQNNIQLTKPTDQNKNKFLGPGLLYDGSVINYFIKESGEIIIVNNNGEIIKKIAEQEEIIKESNGIPKEVLFSNDGSKIIFVFENLINIFNLTTKTWKQINETNPGPSISFQNELAYSKKDGSIFKLDLTKDNASPQKIIQINALDFYLLWKDVDNLFIVSKPSSLNVGSVLLLNTKNKNLSLVYELPGLNLSWDSKFNTGLLFSNNRLGLEGKISLITKDFKNNQLSFLTVPQKCVFDEKTNTNSKSSQTILICAIPKNKELLKNKKILDDWLSYELYTEDDIYQINLDSGFINPILTQQDGIDVDQVKIFKNKLFFINRFDKKLYVLNLP